MSVLFLVAAVAAAIPILLHLFDRRRHVVAAADHTLHKVVERLMGETRALDHPAAFQRLGEAGDGRVHMVVEGEQVDTALPQPVDDFAFRIEIVGLLAQMEAGVGRKLRPHRLGGGQRHGGDDRVECAQQDRKSVV